MVGFTRFSFVAFIGWIADPRLCLVRHTSNQTGSKIKSGETNHLRKREKMGGTGERDPQCATIYCRPTNAQMRDVTFHFDPILPGRDLAYEVRDSFKIGLICTTT